MVANARKSIKKRKKTCSKNKANNAKEVIEERGKVNSDKKNENTADNEDDPWCVAQFFCLDKSQDKDSAMRVNDECNLRSLSAHEGVSSGSNWRTCIDCMLNYCGDWPSLDPNK